MRPTSNPWAIVPDDDAPVPGMLRLVHEGTRQHIAGRILNPADAALMRAAPEMLAWLEQALRYLEQPEVQAIPFALHASVIATQVRAAIAAAKGE